MQTPNASGNVNRFLGSSCAYSTTSNSMMSKPNIFDSRSILDHHSLLKPKGTSTPIHKSGSVLRNKPDNQSTRCYASPTRYLLSKPPTPTNNTIQNSSGPLLASTKYNVNVGTYMDALSPGLSERIVQYSNESKTHQSKYASPGQFPIVHFFKKEIPILQLKPKRVTVRIATPYHSDEHNRLLMEGIMRENNHKSVELINNDQAINDTGTRSVLDALKEISRKRIHTNETYEIGQNSCKRQRLDLSFGSSDHDESMSKRSSISPSGNKPKSTCVVDPITASLSSSFLLKRQLRKTPKRKKSQDEETQILDIQPKKLSNAETQTIVETAMENPKTNVIEINNEEVEKREDTKKTEEVANTNDEISDEITKEPSIRADINILDGAMLESNKKKKLSKLLSIFSGDENSQDMAMTTIVTSESEQKNLTSILSPVNKTKHTKHVTFNIPNETNTSSTLASTVTTTSSLNTPISSPVIIESPKSIMNQNEKPDDITTPQKPPIVSSSSSSEFNSMFKFGTSTSMVETITTKPVITETLSTSSVSMPNSISVPSFSMSSPVSFGGVVQSTKVNSTASVTFTSNTPVVTKIGGFKFDLNKPTSTTDSNFVQPFAGASAFSNQFKLPESTVPTSTPINNNKTTQENPVVTSSSAFGSFVLPATTTKFGTSTTSSFVPTTSLLSKSSPSFSFGTSFNKSPSLGSTNVSSTATSTTAVISPFSKSPTFGLSAPPMPITNTSTMFTPNNTNVQPSSTSTNMNINQPTSVATTMSSLFGANLSQFKNQKPSLFGSNNQTLSFGVKSDPSTTPSAFGGGNTITFAAKNTQSNNVPLIFGASNPALPFGNKDDATTAAPVTTMQSMFCAKTTENMFAFTTISANNTKTNATASLFGGAIAAATNKNTLGSGFSSNMPFGSNATSPFSSKLSTNTFGVNNSQPSTVFPITMNNTNLMFGTITTSTPAFGTNTATKSIFGATTTNSAPVFGASTTASVPAVSAPAFGTATTTSGPMFGTTTVASLNFNLTNNQPFGTVAPSTANSFGQNASSNNQFGTAAFGKSSTNSFGGASTISAFDSNSFSASKPAPAFGANQQPVPAFGANQQPVVPSFGTAQNSVSNFALPNGGNNTTNNSMFGTTPAATGGGVFAFGSSDQSAAKPAPASVFSFGSNEATKPNFNFSSGTNNFGASPAPPAFGASAPASFGSTSSFGTTPAPAFGSGPVPNFGAPNVQAFGGGVTPQYNAPSPGMFSIGAGTTNTNRTRTQLKGRRRT